MRGEDAHAALYLAGPVVHPESDTLAICHSVKLFAREKLPLLYVKRAVRVRICNYFGLTASLDVSEKVFESDTPKKG